MAREPQRQILPIPGEPFSGPIAYDARDATFPPIEPLRPPAWAPNVLTHHEHAAHDMAINVPLAAELGKRAAARGLAVA